MARQIGDLPHALGENVQKLMGLDNLIVAGDHGFDIWSPTGGPIQREVGASFEGLLREVEARLRAELANIQGVLVEPKQRSMAVHFRFWSTTCLRPRSDGSARSSRSLELSSSRTLNSTGRMRRSNVHRCFCRLREAA